MPFGGPLRRVWSGTTPRQLRRIIRQQALLLCLIGIPVGLLFGFGIGAALTPVITATLTFDKRKDCGKRSEVKCRADL